MDRLPKKGLIKRKNKSSPLIHTKSKTVRRNCSMKLKIFGIAVMAMLLLVGCNMNRDNVNEDGANNIEPTRYNDDNINNGNMRDQGTGTRNNGTTKINNKNVGNKGNTDRGDRYNVSKEAADKITDEIDEIHHAYVLTTKNNAYVGAVLDNDERHQSRMNGNKNDGKFGNVSDNSSDRNITNTKNGGNNNRDRAVDEGEELTDEVKDKISDIVQSIDNDIDNVFVTTNPDFADLTNDYMNDFNNGKPVRGFFDQIGNMIERVFPQNKR